MPQFTVCEDPGHGGYDSGAVGPSGILEKDVNLDIALKMREFLVQRGVNMGMTRDGDYTPGNVSPDEDLQERCNIANDEKADIFISIHADSFPDPNAHGATAYCYDGSAEGYKLAKAVLDGLLSTTQTAATLPVQIVKIPDVPLIELDSRGTKLAHFWVLKHTDMPSCLVEVAFLSNPTEEGLLKDPTFQVKAAEGIAKGICNYLGVKWGSVWDPVGEIAKLKAEGLIKSDHLPDEPVTWGVFAAVLNRMRGK